MRRLVLAPLAFTLATTALAEGRVGNGGELITDEQNPWLLGETPATWCVETDEAGTSVSEPELRLAVQLALADWTQTLRAAPVKPTDASVLDGQPHGLTLAFTEQATCAPDTDLRFVVGKRVPDVEAAAPFFARYLVSLALRTSYDLATGRGKGIVWLAADKGPDAYQGPKFRDEFWRSEETLHRVLLHELGHAFGFPHLEVAEGADGDAMYAEGPGHTVAGGPHDGHETSASYLGYTWLTNGREFCYDGKYKALADYLGVAIPTPRVRVCVQALSGPLTAEGARVRITLAPQESDQVAATLVPQAHAGSGLRLRPLLVAYYPAHTPGSAGLNRLVRQDLLGIPHAAFEQDYDLGGTPVHALLVVDGHRVKLVVQKPGAPFHYQELRTIF